MTGNGSVGVAIWTSIAAAALLVFVAVRPARASDGASADGKPRGFELRVKTRPSSVPADFVITPLGYLHPSCVIEVGNDEALDPHGTVRDHKGAPRRKVGRCGFARFEKDGTRHEPPSDGAVGAAVPTVNGWIANAYRAGMPAASWLSASFTVPTTPYTNGAVLYYFPSFMPPAGNYILQPVLGYNHLGTVFTALQK